MKRNLIITFFYTLLFIQGNVVHAGGFCVGQTGLKQESNHHLHLYCCPILTTKSDADKGKSHNFIDERFTYDEDSLHELQNIVTDKSWPSLHRELGCHILQSFNYIF